MKTIHDIRAYNRQAWDHEVEDENQWTIPVSAETIAAARAGDWHIVLTPSIPVPRSWFPSDMNGVRVLCLASGGGQQGPILAATGAQVTVFDNSPRQLAQDLYVAERDGLLIKNVEGDMCDLAVFTDASFDLIVHPVSNIFVPDILPVWRETYRVLRPGGSLLSGIVNPFSFIFDRFKMDDEGILEVKYKLPYSDLTSPSPAEKQRIFDEGWPLEFSHSLEDQIGGQLTAGFVLNGLYEDRDPRNILEDYIPLFLATRAVKP